ncbi:MAG: hypothetical protein IT320_09320 [Anaerolineae bacterium]|nr:hypothetical protein [Anaerolineae bacterium]
MKKKIASLIALGCLIMLMVGSGYAQDMEPTMGGTLRAAWQSGWETLDPHVATSEATNQVLNNVMDTLTFFDDTMNLIPWLAESWEQSEDGLTWTFHLRQDVMFSNGRGMMADDIVWSLNRLIDPDVASGSAWRIGADSTISAIDDYTVEITTSAPNATLPQALGANKFVGILAPESENEDGTIDVPIGTGPFVISEVEGTTRIVLTPNEYYWQDGPYLDSVEIVPYEDDAARELALTGGEVDWIITISPQNLEQLQADPDVVVELSPRLSYDYFGLNLTREPFNNRDVRQAIAYAIDRAQICAFAFFNICEPVQGPTASGSPWYFPYAPYDRNVDMARELLAGAGYGDGFSFVMNTVVGFEETQRAAQVVQQQLAEVGITMEIQPEESAVIIEKEGTGEFDAIMWSWLGLTDAADYFYLQHHTGEVFNFTGYSNPDFDALVESGSQVGDFDERYGIYEQANQILVDDAPYIYMFAKSEVKAWSPSVNGFVVRPDSAVNFWTVWLDQ